MSWKVMVLGYKSATHDKILSVYKQYGLKSVLKSANDILHSSLYHDDVKFRTELQGELCETVLEIIVTDAIAKESYAKDWFFCKGTVLKDRYNLHNDFFTEIDFILFTAGCLYLFECKSYTGDKVLTGKGLLQSSSGRSFDVYKQSVLHKQVIEGWVNDFALRDRSPRIQMCMFLFSNGEVQDKRDTVSKRELPCLTTDNLLSYLKKKHDPVWDLKYLQKVKATFDKNSPKFRKQHLAYVTGLKERRGPHD